MVIPEAFLIWALVVQGAVLASTLVLFFGHGLWLSWYRKRSESLLAHAQTILTVALEEPLLPRYGLDRLRALSVRQQIRLFVNIVPSLSGVQRERLQVLAQEIGLIARAEHRCRSRLWWRRLHGARLLTLLGGGEEVLPPLLRDPYPVVRAQTAEWAADHPSPTLIDALLALLADPDGLCRFTAQDSLLRMGGVVVEPLACYLSASPKCEVEAALEVAVGLADSRFLSLALTLCRDDVPRVRALAATLLGALGGGNEGVRMMMELLTDPAPQVRAAAAQALGKLGHWTAAPTLATLLRDPAWVVRRAAGLALRAFGAPGTLFLRRSLSDSDPFAADMAQQVLDLPNREGIAVSQ